MFLLNEDSFEILMFSRVTGIMAKERFGKQLNVTACLCGSLIILPFTSSSHVCNHVYYKVSLTRSLSRL